MILLLLIRFVIHGKIANILVVANLRCGVFETGKTTWDRPGILHRSHPVLLPLAATINTSDKTTMLAASPLLKAFHVEVLSAGSLAPDEVFTGLHWENTDWTFSINGFARTIVDGFIRFVVVVFQCGSPRNRSIGKDGVELIGQERKLVLQADWGLQNDDEGICRRISVSSDVSA
jgi:hypothetical protein